MDVEEKREELSYKKTVNQTAAVGSRVVGEGDTMDVGPTFVITVPQDYSQEQIEEVLDVAMAAPDTSIGTAIVVREGVCFTPLNQGHRRCSWRDEGPDEDDDPDVDGWGE